jgi:conjugative relaxase-like TrwC/TraI family protein
MLSVTKVKSSSKTTEYFAKDDYYASNDPNHQKFSNWYGKGAEELDLEGNVKAEDFKAILDGKLPNGQQIGVSKGMDVVHDPGRDLTFSAPKSVSIMALVYDDKRLIEAHNQAVKNTLDEIEKDYLKTRVRKGDEINLKSTGKMVAAMFRHELSRDLDPQLHTHTIVANLTADEKGKWRSAYFDEIYDNKKFLGLIYRSELAKLVKELGYEIEHKGKECFFELKNVPQELNNFFSNRSKKIRSLADENTTQKELERITLKSRENKSVKEYEHNLGQTWREKVKDFLPKFDAEKIIKSSSREVEIIHKPVLDTRSDTANTAKQAVDFAVKHLSERKTVFSKNEIISTALNDTLSKTNLGHITKAVNALVAKDKLLPVKKDELEKNTYTTSDLLAKENAIIKMMIAGKNKHNPITTNLDKYSDILSKLNDGQKRSAELILSNKDMITGIQGFAGVGKTFMLKAVNQIAKSEGYQLLGLSPTGVATRNLNIAADIESMTLQRFLMQYDGVAMGRGTQEGRVEMREEFKDKVVVIDEASMISTVQMKNLLTIASELKFKLVLVGDRRQLDSVEAGVPFYEMQRNGMPFADMREIIRQKNPQLKSAVYSTIKRDIEKAFKEIEYDVFETKDVANLAVKKFMELSQASRNNSIILTPANETREEVNNEISRLIHEERKQQTQNKEHVQEIYQNKNLSEAEKTRAYRFKEGDIILFSKDRNFIGVKRNTYCQVTKIDAKENLVTIKTGLFTTQTFNPIKLKGKAAKNYFEVFSKTERIFREGDRVAFNRSIPELKIINSDGAVLSKIDRLNFYLRLDSSGKEIKIRKTSSNLKHLDYSYAVTAHKAQGLTCQNVIAVCESTRDKLTSQKNFYVEISRAEERAIVITDDKEKVIEKLKENTGVEISAREHQDIAHLGINMIKPASKPQVEIPRVEKQHVEKKQFIVNYSQVEIRDHFIEAIKSAIKIDAADAIEAVEKSLENKSEKIRFGQKKEYEICWHGEV